MSPKTSNKSKSVNHLSKEVWGILFLFLAIFSFLSLISFSNHDPSIFSQNGRIPTNYGGRVGANLASALIQLSGLGSFFLVGLCLTLAARFFQGAKTSQLATNALCQLFAFIAGTTFLSLTFGTMVYGGLTLSSGGLIGGVLARLLLHYFNPWGATLFSLCILLIALVFATPISATTLWHKLLIALSFLGQWFHTQTLRVGTFLMKEWEQRAEIARTPTSTKIPEIAEPTKRIEIARSVAVEEEEQGLTIGMGHEAIHIEEPVKTLPQKSLRPSSATATGSGLQGNWQLPLLGFLKEPPVIETELNREKLIENSRNLEQKLSEFGIRGQVVAVRPGPVITMYEFKPGAGVKISQIASRADDLSLALEAQSVRIVAPIPGKSVVGIEIPNEDRATVYLRELLATEEFQGSTHEIPIAVGKEISGAPIIADIAATPHLLIAGSSGAGKSVFINTLITSLLYKYTPRDMRLIMVDPKQLELALYDKIPHLLLPVVHDSQESSTALRWAVNEMERRYGLMAKAAVRNIKGYNQKMKGNEDAEHLPFILVIIDEFADLMMTARKDIETNVSRLAAKARAAGIHLIIATQRPSTDVITGVIKNNLPSRIAFKVPSQIDSRTILDSMGAEKLLGKGDMLFIPPGLSRIIRVHGAYIDEEEISKICDFWRAQGEPVYKEEILIEPDEEELSDEADGLDDPLYEQAIILIREEGLASASRLQRRFKIGYNRAARLIETMEAHGVVGPGAGSKPREVLY